ncbi:MAG: hypothetical protein GXY44_00445 [Phycisphaerales bacterium]|nr:hypothetical protein [Phycisphaerales bacterium]
MPDGSFFQFWDDQTQYRMSYHVAKKHPLASDANPGTSDKPWKTIGRAAEMLQPGEKVIVHEGRYREQVMPRRGGNGPDSMIAYEAAPGEEVIISGAEAWVPRCLPSAGWHTGNAGIWMADLPGELFGGYNPFLARNIYEEVVSYSNFAEMARYMLHRGAVFVDGLPLKQVYRFAELTGQDGAFWVEEPGLRLHFRLPGRCGSHAGGLRDYRSIAGLRPTRLRAGVHPRQRLHLRARGRLPTRAPACHGQHASRPPLDHREQPYSVG